MISSEQMDNPLHDTHTEEREIYEPTEEEQKFITDVWREFYKCYVLKQDSQPVFDGLTLQNVWNECVRSYANLLSKDEDENDPVKEYPSAISRDKSDVFIANLSGQLMYPDVVAQNAEQEIDRIMGRVSSAVLLWAHKHDGWPSENGMQKNARYIHKSVVEGTAHVLDIVSEDGLESELIPNEEMFIPNFWQPNIQKQPRIFRAKMNILFEEAEQLFGDCDNFKYVYPGAWLNDMAWVNSDLKNDMQGIVREDRVSVLYVWKEARPQELKELKRKRRVSAKAKRACFYNVLVNNIPMFPIDNLSPYKHGYYPVSKIIFCKSAYPEFYWGVSAPWKIRHDKRWLDAWKTLIRYKGKLGILKPSLVIGGHIDEEIMLPSKLTDVPEGVEVKPIEGVSDGVSQSDVMLLNMAQTEIDRGSVSPQVAGQSGVSRQTARAAVIQASNSQRLLDAFSQEVAFFMQSRSFHILLSEFQFLTKGDLKKIAIPDQKLSNGLQGTMEVIFSDPGMLTKNEELIKSFELRAARDQSAKAGSPKETIFINPSYTKDIKFYLFSDAGSSLQDKNAIKQLDFQKDLELMLNRADLFLPKEVASEYIHMKGYNERILNKEQASPQAGGPPGQSGQKPSGTPPQQISPENKMASQASEQMTGQKMPALAPNLG